MVSLSLRTVSMRVNECRLAYVCGVMSACCCDARVTVVAMVTETVRDAVRRSLSSI